MAALGLNVQFLHLDELLRSRGELSLLFSGFTAEVYF